MPRLIHAGRRSSQPALHPMGESRPDRWTLNLPTSRPVDLDLGCLLRPSRRRVGGANPSGVPSAHRAHRDHPQGTRRGTRSTAP